MLSRVFPRTGRVAAANAAFASRGSPFNFSASRFLPFSPTSLRKPPLASLRQAWFSSTPTPVQQLPKQEEHRSNQSSSDAGRQQQQQQQQQQQKQQQRKSSGNAESETAQQRNRRYALYLGAIIIGGLGLTYLTVPLYTIFCQMTGFGGTVKRDVLVADLNSWQVCACVRRRRLPSVISLAASRAAVLSVASGYRKRCAKWTRSARRSRCGW
jgi:hypothetical protein